MKALQKTQKQEHIVQTPFQEQQEIILKFQYNNLHASRENKMIWLISTKLHEEANMYLKIDFETDSRQTSTLIILQLVLSSNSSSAFIRQSYIAPNLYILARYALNLTFFSHVYTMMEVKKGFLVSLFPWNWADFLRFFQPI